MKKETRKLITIVTESALENALTNDLLKLGATGYTVTEARGSGSRGVRDAGWSTSGNVRIEVVCTAEIGDRIAEHVRDNYYADYAMIFFETDVGVIRGDKF